MKPVLLNVLFLIAALATVAIAANSSWGSRNKTDVLIWRENVERAALKNGYQSAELSFPKSGQTNNRTISAIYVYDRFTNSSGASAYLYSGGPNYRSVKINFKSQYNRGINSTVEIYGKK